MATLPQPISIASEATFDVFGRFPTEIRLKIWEAALPGPRIMQIKHGWIKPNFNERVQWLLPNEEDGEKDLRMFYPRCAPPQILYACRESYEITNAHYERVFGTEATPPIMRFNFRQDILYVDATAYLGGGFWLPCLPVQDRRRVRHLALRAWGGFIYLSHPHLYEKFLAEVLCCFPYLKQLTFTKRGPGYTYEDTTELLFADSCSRHETLEMYTADTHALQEFKNNHNPLDMVKLNACRARLLAVDEMDLLPLPAIDYNVITSQASRLAVRNALV